MTWPESYFNYRVVKAAEADGHEPFYGIFEVHYEHGVEVATNDRPIIVGDDIEELKRVMIQLLDAFDKPVYDITERKRS